MAITVSQKSVLRSKTMWASAVTIGLGVIASHTGINFVAGESTVILGFVFMVLRLVTNSQINLTADTTATDVPVTPVTPVEPVTPTPDPMPEPTPEPTPSPMPEPTAAATAATAEPPALDRIAAAVEQLKDYREFVVTIKYPENQGRRF